jgi:hypothetical protein
MAIVKCYCLDNHVVCKTFYKKIRVLNRRWWCWGHGHVHQGEIT